MENNSTLAAAEAAAAVTTTKVEVPDVSKFHITERERLDLRRMVHEQNAEDHTASIRELKHSTQIAQELLQIQKKMIAEKCSSLDPDVAAQEAPFLYQRYTDIFHRAAKGELNLKLMAQFLQVLKQIENEKIDAHEGGLLVGKLLKEIYVDSAMRRQATADARAEEAAAAEKKDTEDAAVKREPPLNISWKEFKSSRVST